jgi:polysaccharide pyruvyl transferase WcaK-like protein
MLATMEVAVVPIDTRLDENATGLRTPAEVESLIARMDVVVTTRLHGLVLALKNGVPTLAVDPIAGGAKVRRQAETLGWTVALESEGLKITLLRRAFDYCLTRDARSAAKECADRAAAALQSTRETFLRFQVNFQTRDTIHHG